MPEPTPWPEIAFLPHAKVTEQKMLQDGLLLWLDASAESTLQQTNGALTRWHDRRMNGRVAVAGAGMKRTIVHCTGESGLDAGTVRAAKGPATVLVVAGSASTAAKPWERIFVSWSGEGPDWVSPSSVIMRPHGGNPAPFEPRMFLVEHANAAALDNVHLASSAQGAGQSFLGDLAEVLVFDRLLRFDELLAIQNYLRGKWSLPFSP